MLFDDFTDVQLRARVELEWRFYARICENYGVSAFDSIAFRVLYPQTYAFIQRINAELRQRAQ